MRYRRLTASAYPPRRRAFRAAEPNPVRSLFLGRTSRLSAPAAAGLPPRLTAGDAPPYPRGPLQPLPMRPLRRFPEWVRRMRA